MTTHIRLIQRWIFGIVIAILATIQPLNAYNVKDTKYKVSPRLQAVKVHEDKEHRVKEKSMTILKMHEGFSSKPYKCPEGKWTYGYGKLTKANKGSISKKKAEVLLQKDIDEAILQLDKCLPWWRELNVARQSVMINLTYNLGIDKFLKFKQFLHYMKTKQFTKASNTLVYRKGKYKTRYARQTGNRAIHIAHAIKYGKWPLDEMKEIYEQPG